ncbi:OLC1v1025522C1 [Oldenlandia corymbosa var. corymbosa]|uniref:OLC1v1025522C1 n=1 Tax=Oldenlandia corymbosa var. corymbosa TaxID=529605 RepID=A0AAV1C6R5_OLDCO|nr:OLC1v1025522C1 [Oldenlandia corymbosa var. corymbosa]
MAKSLRSKREKRLKAIRREIVEPLYQKKEEAKLAAQEAALNAPKLPVRSNGASSMDFTASTSNTSNNDMDVEMAVNESMRALKPIGKKLKKKIKLAKRKGRKSAKGKIRRKNI